MRNSLSISKKALTLVLVLTALFLVLTVLLCVGTNGYNSVVAFAEEEATSFTYDYDESEFVVAHVSDEELTLWGDAEFEISSKRGAGETLIAVYATYTSGKLSGAKLTLDYNTATNTYILYGVCGDFTLSGEWVATWFEPVWTYNTSQCTVTSEMPTQIQVGIGLPLEEMPSVDGTQLSTTMYFSEGWSVTGTLKDGSSYSLGYIPADAISATCSAKLTDATTHVYYTTTDVNDSTRPSVVGEGVVNKDYNKSNGTPVGVYAAGDTIDPYSGIDCTVNTSGTQYRYGFLGHVSNSSRPYNKRLDEGCTLTFTNDAGATEYYNGMGFYRQKTTRSSTAVYDHSMLIIPVRFDNALKRDLLAGTYSSIRVTVTARILVGAKNVSSNARTNAWLDLEEGIKTRLNGFSYSENSASVDGYPRTLINGEWKTDLSFAHNSSTNPATITSGYITSTSWGGAQGVYSKTIQTTATSGFTIGFRATYYTNSGNGVTKHFALINTMTYTVEALDADGNASKAQSYTVNLNGNAPDGATVQESVKEGTADTISATSHDSSMQLNSVPWAYEGYEFTGWSTDSGASVGDKSLALNGTTDGSLSYYAIWQKKKYPYLEYDIYNGDNSFAGLMRTDGESNARVGVCEHGTSVSLSEAGEGNNSYVGFGDPTTKSILGVSGLRENWIDWGEETSFTITSPTVIGFVREMKYHEATLSDEAKAGITISYGNSIVLGDLVSYEHELNTVTFRNSWLKEGEEDVYDYVEFEGAPILTQVLESGSYKFECVAVAVINGVLGDAELTRTITTDATDFTITPIALIITWLLDGEESFVVTYNGLPRVMSVVIEGEVNGEDVSATLSGNSRTIVGSDTAIIEAISSTNYVYDEAYKNKEFTINPAELTVNWFFAENNLSIVEYDGEERTITAELIGIANNETVTATVINTTQINAGIYTAEITAIDSTNYVIKEGDETKVYEITPIVINVEWIFDSFNGKNNVIYDASEHSVFANITNMVGTDIVNITYDGTLKAINKGNYTASVTGIDNDNYTLENAEGLFFDWSILGMDITASWTIGEYVYNGEYQYPSLTLVGFDTADKVYFVIDFYKDDVLVASKKVSGNGSEEYTFNSDDSTQLNGESISAGDYEISFDGVVYDENSVEILKYNRVTDFEAQPYSIAKKKIDGSGNWDYYYDGGALNTYIPGTTQIEYVGTSYTLVSSINTSALCYRADTGLKDTVSIDYLNNKMANAGDYTATIVISSNDYEIGQNASVNWSILPKQISIDWSINGDALLSPVFNGESYTINATAMGLVEGETCSVTLSGDITNVESGNYTVTAVSLDNTNYKLPTEVSKNWSVLPLAVILNWGSYEYIYDGTEKSVSATISNILEDYTCELTYSNNVKTNAGNYTAEVTALSSKNYTLEGATNASFDWRIAKKEVSLLWTIGGEQELIKTYNASAFTIVANASGLIGNDTCNVTIIGETVKTNVGDYTATASSLTNSNYALPSEVDVSWSITALLVEIAWGEGAFTYDGNEKNVGAIVNNRQGDDEVSFTYESNEEYTISATDAGNYVAKIVGVTNTNYILGDTNLTYDWSIAKKTVSLSWKMDDGDKFSVEYDGQDHVVSVVADTGVIGETVLVNVENGINKLANNSYVATAVLLDNDNYKLPEENTKSYEITQRELTLVWSLDGTQNLANVPYDGEAHVVTATLSNVVSGESVNVLGYVGEVVSGNGTITNGNTATIVSTYKTSISGISDENNYKVSAETLSYQWGIQYVALTVDFEINASIYNGQSQGLTAIISGVSASDLLNITFATVGSTAPNISSEVKEGKYYVYFNAVNKGDYTAVISSVEGENGGNYQLPEDTECDFSIAPRVIDIAWNVELFVYSKQNKQITASVTNGVSGDTINLEYKTTGVSYEVEGANGVGNVALNAGEYLTEVVAQDNVNYVLDQNADLTKSWSIGAKLVDKFTWSLASLVYNANVQSVSAQVANGATGDNDGMIYDGDTLALTYVGRVAVDEGASAISANEATNAGEYVVSISDIGNQNYYFDSEEVTFVIEKAQIAVASTSSWSKVYNKSENYLDYSYSGVIDGTTVTLNASYDDVNAGARELQFILAGQDSDNYYLTFNGLAVDVDYVQIGKEYTINANVASIARKSVSAEGKTSKVFDGTTEINSFVIAESEIEEGDVVTVIGAYESALVGDVNIALAIVNQNYLLTNTSLQGKIAHKPLSVEWTANNAIYTYNGELQGVKAVVNGMIAGYEEEVYVSGSVEGVLDVTIATKNAGEYSVTLSLGSTTNYTLDDAVVSANWTINKKVLGIDWSTDSLGEIDASDNVFGWAGFLCQYSKVERFIEATLTGIVGSDSVQAVVTGDKAINSGDYNANVSEISGIDKDNYKLPESTSQEWSIVRASILGVELLDASFVYDKTTHGVYVSSNTTQFGDVIDIVYSGGINYSEAVDAGTYNIEAILDAGANYQPLTLNATMVIDKADITGITLEGVNTVYDGTMKSVTLSGTTTVYGDEITVEYTLSGITAGGVNVNEVSSAIKDAGNYQVSATLNAGDNYNEKILYSDIVIGVKEIVLSWNNISNNEGVYNGKAQGLTLNVAGIVDGDEISISVENNINGLASELINFNGDYSFTAINANSALYKVSVNALSGADSVNYSLSQEKDAQFSILPRQILVNAWTDGVDVYNLTQDIRFVYAKKNYELTPIFASGCIVEGEEDAVEILLSGNQATNAGEYTVNATLANANSNYTMVSASKNWYVEAKEVDLVWDKVKEITYDGKDHNVKATVKGLLAGDDVELVYANNSGKNAGKYVAEVVSLGNPNYKVSQKTQKQTMTINPVEISGVELFDKEVVFNGKGHGVQISKNKTQYGDSINVSIQIFDKDGNIVSDYEVSEAGIYTIKATLDAGNNYVIRDLDAKLTIKSLAIQSPVKEGEEKVDVNVESENGFMPGSVIESTVTSVGLTERYDVPVKLSGGERVAAVYELSLVYENQVNVLNGNASVKMLIPAELQGSDFRIVNVSNGEETELEYVVEDGYVLVATDKLDAFVFIYEPAPSAIAKAYSGWLALSVAIALVLLVILLVIAFLKKTRTIKFVANGVEVEGGSIDAVKARFGTKVDLPKPKVQSMCYQGWYADEEFTEKAGRNQRPSKKTRLYAKTMGKGTKTKIPQSFIDGMKFEGWYEDEACTKKANVSKMGRKNLTLYAKWGKKKGSKLPIYPWEQ